ncbi:MAG TPA: patatin-like phospholipase family protein [Pyrinomonadaceae bacterium]|nr:patatin-like phospholipase family protein [Pyrinomonadaceae bacterium]
MAASSPKPPLFLFQVLEDEYAALHGEQPPDLDWRFRANHIIYAESMIKRLDLTSFNQTTQKNQTTTKKTKPPIKATADPDEVAKNALIQYLHDELVEGDFKPTASGGAELVAQALNQFLSDPNLFAEERFSNYWLNSATRGLRELHTSSTIIPGALGYSGGPLTGPDLEHFNRLLLEDAFPHSLKKIHRLRLDAIYRCIHEKKQAALCFSGGGIRSGTFALGLLQGLARHNLLNKFHFLSTVSGGGYIGSWLAAWIHRHPAGLSGVTNDLANKTPSSKVDPDPDPIRFLRRYSSFITPQVGLLSADTWTFVAIYLRNLLLNWMVFIPLLLSVLTLPRFIVSITTTTSSPDPWKRLSTALGTNVYSRHFLLAAGFVTVVWALAYIMFNRPTLKEELRQASPFWRRKTSQRWFLCLCLLPLSIAAFCLTTYWAWSSQNGALPKQWPRFMLFGALVTFLAWLIASYVLKRIRPSNWKELFSRDMLYLLVAGAAGGGLLYLLTVKFDPFRGGPEWSCDALVPIHKLSTELYACFAAPAFLLVFLLGATLYIGVTSKSTAIDDEDREWWSRLGAWVLIAILGWISFTTIVIIGPIALLKAPQWLAPLGGLSGVLAAIIGRSARTDGRNASNGERGGMLDAVIGKALPVLALIFVVFLVALLSLGTSGITRFAASSLVAFSEARPSLDVRDYLASAPTNFERYVKCIYSSASDNIYERWMLAHMNVVHMTSFRLIALLGVLLGLIGCGISLLINLNIFSLHAGYRNRLIRAFLGASRPEHQRKPNPFTGFDPADNVAMHELRPGLFAEDDFPRALALASVLLKKTEPDAKSDAVEIARYLRERNLLPNLQSVPDPNTYSIRLVAALRKDLNGVLRDSEFGNKFSNSADKQTDSLKTPDAIFANRAILQKAFGSDWLKPLAEHEEYRLMPVINTTLNLVGGDNLAWQQRKAEPFSVSPLHAGCFRLGYRDSRFYGGRDVGGISIGTAAAISGAAASSNMGYYTTSPVLSLVLTFFNVRLGWWLGNPGSAGKDTFELRAPRSSVKPVLEEAFGMTDDENKYIYLTDGGHFENLGIYEMVLRRCHLIVISDAAADPDYNFGDLGNAIRKVRIDLGVPIEFTAMPIFSPDSKDYDKKKGMYWAVGRIRYSCIDGDVQDGLLVYIKPAVYGREPGDVLEYKKSHPTFPHQSTADQFFDEPQFESYRILGSHVMDEMCGSDYEQMDLDKVIDNVVDKLIDTSDNGPADKELKKWFDEWRDSAPTA